MKKRTVILQLAVAILCSAILSCSTNAVPSSKVPRSKLLRYYYAICTNGGVTYVKAFFYTDAHLDQIRHPYGKAVELDPPAAISFNGSPMKLHKGFWTGVYYGSEASQWPRVFRFEWTDNEGKVHADSAEMDTIRPASDWLLTTPQGYAVAWVGSPVREGETVSVLLGKEEDSNRSFSTSEVGARTVPIPVLPLGFSTRLYKAVEITRTLNRHTDIVDTSDDAEDGVLFELIYSVKQ